MSKLTDVSDKKFIEIVESSYTLSAILEKLGYMAKSGSITQLVKNRIIELNLDISHFYSNQNQKVVRSEENIFIENSTAAQSTVRKWYLRGNYTEYKCAICNQEPFWNEKDLTLTLDHVNGNNKDHRLENLRWICPNCDRQLNTFGAKNYKFKVSSIQEQKPKNYCKMCKTEITFGANHCIVCSHKLQRIADRPVREELKQKIRNESFVSIGREYGVSDNAIRKWCESEKLPSKKRDIIKYTNEEWKLI